MDRRTLDHNALALVGPTLRAYGWDAILEESFHSLSRKSLRPARVIGEYRGSYRVMVEFGELAATLSGTFSRRVENTEGLPTVGDWVALQPVAGVARIEAVLPRKSCFRRKSPGGGLSVQNIAANIDKVFLMMSLNRNFNLRRLERFLVASWASGAQPLVLLSKADLSLEWEDQLQQAQSVSVGVPTLAISSLTGQGLEDVRRYISPGRTIAVLGSSGVGKSTLLNTLYGRPLLETADVRSADDRGRHTTTSRQLVLLPGGGLFIDTPGLRELGLWDADNGVARVFEDIEDVATRCRFKDCTHEHEPGCAVKEALARGYIETDRVESYRKLQRELEYSVRRSDSRLEREQKRKWRILHKRQRRIYKENGKRGWRSPRS